MKSRTYPSLLIFCAVTSLALVPRPGQALGCNGQGANSYHYDFEAGAGGWTQDGMTGTWSVTATRSNSPSFSAFTEAQAVPIDLRTYPPILTLHPGTNFLRFWHWQEIESVSSDPTFSCYDGGVIEISMVGNPTWVRLDSEIVNTPYDGLIHSSTGNILAGESAWCGDSRDWHETVVDLSAYSGNQVEIRFRLSTDNSTGREGWYIDDVSIENCDGVFFDGFESGNTSGWTLVSQ